MEDAENSIYVYNIDVDIVRVLFVIFRFLVFSKTNGYLSIRDASDRNDLESSLKIEIEPGLSYLRRGTLTARVASTQFVLR